MSTVPFFRSWFLWARSLLYCCIAERYSGSICERTRFRKRLLSSPESLTRAMSDGDTMTIGISPTWSETLP